MPPKTPILVFTYNRPGHTNRLFESLSRCYRVEECQVFVFCDEARYQEEYSSIQMTRETVRRWQKLLSLKVVYRERNLGLSRSIIQEVTWACEAFGRCIVLEDDLVLRPDFLDFMLQGLAKYQDSEKVFQVSGFIWDTDNRKEIQPCFLPLVSTWGWGVWQRSWKFFSAPGARERLADPKFRIRFDLENSFPYSQMLEDRLNGKNESWGILWLWTLIHHQKLSLFPGKSLVFNSGLDGSGVHGANPPQRPIFPQDMALPIYTSRLDFPNKIQANNEVLWQIAAALRKLMGYPKFSLTEKVKMLGRGTYG